MAVLRDGVEVRMPGGEMEVAFNEAGAWVDSERAAAEETSIFQNAVLRLGTLSAEADAQLRARQRLCGASGGR